MNNKIKYCIALFVLMVCFACNQQEPKENMLSKQELVEAYYLALNTNNFRAVHLGIADSLTQISGLYTETWSRDSFVNWLEWDASFSPVYKVHSTEIISENKVGLTLSKTCKRIQYLHDEPTKYNEIIHFENNKIKTIEAGESLVFNDSLWVARRDALVSFINKNHPELDGFIFDQTKEGAENYLKAIALFTEAQNKTE